MEEIFSPTFCIFRRKFSIKDKIFRQAKIDVGGVAPFHPSQRQYPFSYTDRSN